MLYCLSKVVWNIYENFGLDPHEKLLSVIAWVRMREWRKSHIYRFEIFNVKVSIVNIWIIYD